MVHEELQNRIHLTIVSLLLILLCAQAQAQGSDDDDKTMDCSICLQSLEGAPRVLPCGHQFHADCIGQMIAAGQHYSRFCPLCRAPMADPDLPEQRPELQVFEPLLDYQNFVPLRFVDMHRDRQDIFYYTRDLFRWRGPIVLILSPMIVPLALPITMHVDVIRILLRLPGSLFR